MSGTSLHCLFSTLLLYVCVSSVSAQCKYAHSSKTHGSLAEIKSIKNHAPNKCPKFRTLDGTCTSKGNKKCSSKLWGSADSTQFSYFPNHSSTIPTRQHLPSPRLISNVLSTQTQSQPNRRGLREFFVFFGEFLDHNLVFTPPSDERFDIPIPESDTLLSNFSRGYLPFLRAKRQSVSDQHSEGAERAVNEVTSALDLSAVYGSSEARARLLRTFEGGMLKTSRGNFLPFNSVKASNEPSHSDDFFLAGDVRVNDHPVLTSIQTIFMREHNYWCDKLAAKYPTMKDERLYQRARQINIAKFQYIVYKQFIPAITGRELPRYKRHDPCVNPTVSDIFSTAAYRIGHTLVGNNVQRRGVNMSPLPPLDFTKMFFRPAKRFLRKGMETFIRGALDTSAQEVDTQVSSSLRNFLFTNVRNFKDNVDLIAINIQRGRDNALPGYNAIRTVMGLKALRSFDEMTSNIATQTKLSTLYRSPDEVDPWIGLMAEDHVKGASMGATVRRIWEREFSRLRDGDRLFYLGKKYFSKRLLKDFPELKVITSRKKNRDIMKDLIVQHTSIRKQEITGSSVFKM